jgi:hypothetical protein
VGGGRKTRKIVTTKKLILNKNRAKQFKKNTLLQSGFVSHYTVGVIMNRPKIR